MMCGRAAAGPAAPWFAGIGFVPEAMSLRSWHGKTPWRARAAWRSPSGIPMRLPAAAGGTGRSVNIASSVFSLPAGRGIKQQRYTAGRERSRAATMFGYAGFGGAVRQGDRTATLYGMGAGCPHAAGGCRGQRALVDYLLHSHGSRQRRCLAAMAGR